MEVITFKSLNTLMNDEFIRSELSVNPKTGEGVYFFTRGSATIYINDNASLLDYLGGTHEVISSDKWFTMVKGLPGSTHQRIPTWFRK